jgi:hypothetical protein
MKEVPAPLIKYGLVPVLLSASAFAQQASSVSEQSEALAAIREYALNYTQRLPDYRCTQVTQWKTSAAPLLRDRQERKGVLETEIGFLGHREMEKITTINGKPAEKADPRDLPQTSSRGEFGTLLARIFDPRSSTEFRWNDSVTRDGRRSYLLSYRVPQASGYVVQAGKRSTRVAFTGFVYADVETKAVTRIEMQGVDFPVDSEYLSLELTLNYKLNRMKLTDGSEGEFVLPSDFKLNSRQWNGATMIDAEINAQYKDYRRFGADAKIQFGPADSEH